MVSGILGCRNRFHHCEHRRLYTFSDEDYQGVGQIWKGVHPTDGGKLEAFSILPGYSGAVPD